MHTFLQGSVWSETEGNAYLGDVGLAAQQVVGVGGMLGGEEVEEGLLHDEDGRALSVVAAQVVEAEYVGDAFVGFLHA